MRRGMMPSEANGRNGDTLLAPMKSSELAGAQESAGRRGLLRRMADSVEAAGRRGDTELVHANPREVAMLERVSGNRGRNPATNKREFNWAGIDSQGQTDDGKSEIDIAAAEAEAAPTTDETSLFDKAKNAVAGVLGLDKKGDITGKGLAAGLLGGLGPPGFGTVAGVVAGVIGDRNVAQIENARANGSLSEADYQAIQDGGRGTIRGGGLMGEDVTVGLNGANSDPDRGNPNDAGGQGGAQDPSPPNVSARRAANYTGTRGLYLPAADEEGEYKYDPTSQRMRWITKER